MRALPFALTIFLSAFLLFQVQPLIGRYILPWFGGSAGVWSVTMLFFQIVLLAGYGYAHLLNSKFKPNVQVGVHIVLLGVCAALLPIVPAPALKPAPDAQPVLSILLLLAATVGAPYFALSTTGPLLQAWYARALPGKSPYALYSLSNIGSLLALVSYPFVFEPLWGRQAQAVNWSWGFGLFALACAGSAVLMARTQKPAAVPTPEAQAQAPQAPPTRVTKLLWVLLPAVASTLLLALTNELCVDVASVPFLWVLPLSIYLLSFILTFAGKSGPRRLLWYPLALLAIAGTVVLFANPLKLGITPIAVGYCVMLLILCYVLHGEAYRIRPGPARLTQFYLYVSLGGVLGGLFVAVVSPVVFVLHMELPVALVVGLVLLFACLWKDKLKDMPVTRVRYVMAAFALLLMALLASLGLTVFERTRNRIHLSRNFYGTYAVYEPPKDSSEPWHRSLHSGTTLHGMQFMEPEYRGVPATYYGRHSGVGMVMETLDSSPHKIGVVGLGVGTMAAYCRDVDTIRFYEINPRCPEIAQDLFFYLRETPAKYEIVMGDARLSLEAEPDQGYDVLLLDAFTSDSVPVHLLTLECMQLCHRHLKPGGVLCIHVSNRYLDLAPVVKAGAARLNMNLFGITSAEYTGLGATAAWWMILSDSKLVETRLDERIKYVHEKLTPWDMSPKAFCSKVPPSRWRDIEPWTDDFSNLFDVLK